MFLLKNTRTLLIYGLAGDLVAPLAPIGVDYMTTQAAWLKSQGAEVSVVDLPTATAVTTNAARIAETLLSDPRPALLIAHSKGGLETLAALLLPNTATHSLAFLAIQSPFLGSPVADAIMATTQGQTAVDLLARALRRGTNAGVRDLTTPVRTTWMRTHTAEIETLTATIPVICCASTLDDTAIGPDRRYLPLARWMQRKGAGPNDGLVPVASALLQGARHVLLQGSHRGLTSKGKGRDPIAVLTTMLNEIP